MKIRKFLYQSLMFNIHSLTFPGQSLSHHLQYWQFLTKQQFSVNTNIILVTSLTCKDNNGEKKQEVIFLSATASYNSNLLVFLNAIASIDRGYESESESLAFNSQCQSSVHNHWDVIESNRLLVLFIY